MPVMPGIPTTRSFHLAAGNQDLVVVVDRLHNFLNFVVLAQIYLHEKDPATSQALNRYRLTLLGVVGTVESFLEDSDFDQLGVHLACSLSTALLDYRSVSEAVMSGVNATAAALNRTASFADADQSQLTAGTSDARSARDRFNRK